MEVLSPQRTPKVMFSVFLLLAIVVLGVKLNLALSTPYLSDDASYFSARQLQHMMEYGKPMRVDDKYSAQREIITQPYWYLLLPVAQITNDPVKAIKIFSNITATLLVLCVYWLAFTISKSPTASFIAGLCALLSPVLTSQSINSSNPLSLVLLLLLFSTIFLIRSAATVDAKQQKFFFGGAIVSYIIALLLHISAIIYLVGIIFFMLIARTEKIKVAPFYAQFWIITFTISVWIFLMLYKDALLFHGSEVFYQNIPFALRLGNFIENNIFVIFGSIGVLPILAAVYACLRSLRGSHIKGVFLVCSLGLAALLLGLLTTISIYLAVGYIAICCSVLVAPALVYLKQTVSTMKITLNNAILALVATIIIILTLGGPVVAIAYKETALAYAPSDEMLSFLKTIEPNAIIVTSPSTGSLYAYFTQKTVALDSNFLFVKNSDDRYNNLERIYSAIFINDVVESLNNLGVGKKNPGYIISQAALAAESENCLNLVFEEENSRVYRSDCEVVEYG